MEEKPLVIGIAGFGIVGGGLCRLLRDNAEIIRRRAGRDIFVKYILVRDAQKKRDVAPPENAKIITEPAEMLNDATVDVVIELMGGIDEAEKLVKNALANGKHVVTANKALLASRGEELFGQASSHGRILRYEASVAGAIPVVEILKESLNGNRINSLVGILNGTSNYILSEMTTNGLDFDIALKQAQDQGFAEADPSLDIDGLDAAHKLIVLIRLAFGSNYPLEKLSVEGIRGLNIMDIRLAREFGYRIKLIGRVKTIPENSSQSLAAGIFPALVHHSFLLARVGGSYNALRIDGNASGPLFFHGKGAGSLPTAGAVLADLLAVARKESPNNTGFVETPLPPAAILPADDWSSCYYVRVMVEDTPGILRDISGCMAAQGISVAQMIQKAEEGQSGVPLVFMTHETTARAMKMALANTMKMGLLREPAVYYRVLEKEGIN